MFVIAHCNSCDVYIGLRPYQEYKGFPVSPTDPLNREALIAAPFVIKEQWQGETLSELGASVQGEDGYAYAGSMVCLECVNKTGKSIIDIIEPAAVLTTLGSWLFLYKHRQIPKEIGYD